ncbi:hypothetical protein Ndes2437B_g09139 [Nannochloris sp. 'desiccata']|nr:hypothetical protein KSW81_001121 [Chlorella desiccata (nom. nud.)]
MLGVLARKRTAFAACGGAALRRPIELINTLLAKSPDLSSFYSTGVNVSDKELQSAAISAIYDNVPVGSRLELKLGSQPVQVATAIGTSPEKVELYAWTIEQLEKSNTPVLYYGIRNNYKSDASTIWASLQEHTENNATSATSAATLPNAPKNTISKILAIVPSRYFSFDIETGGGAVNVAASKEASIISVKTHGGAITGGSLQASSISLESRGGAIAMKQLTASEIDIKSNGGDISVNTLAGLSMNVDSSGASSAAAATVAAVRIGACFVEKKGEFLCGTFIADSLRGGTDADGSIHVKLTSGGISPCNSTGTGAAQNVKGAGFGATVGGIDGALSISSNQGPAIIDLQINEGCRDVMVDTSSRGNTTTAPSASTVNLHVAPTLAAHVVLNECGKDWMLPADTHVVLGEDTTRNIYAQLNVEDDEQLGPRSRLQRGNNDDFEGQAGVGAMPCTLAVRGAGQVRVRRRSWMQARQEVFRLKQL